MKGGERQALQPQDVAVDEAETTPAATFHLKLSRLDHDESVGPLGVGEGPGPSWPDLDHPADEWRRQPPAPQELESGHTRFDRLQSENSSPPGAMWHVHGRRCSMEVWRG